MAFKDVNQFLDPLGSLVFGGNSTNDSSKELRRLQMSEQRRIAAGIKAINSIFGGGVYGTSPQTTFKAGTPYFDAAGKALTPTRGSGVFLNDPERITGSCSDQQRQLPVSRRSFINNGRRIMRVMRCRSYKNSTLNRGINSVTLWRIKGCWEVEQRLTKRKGWRKS